jgi:hypothetical protein
MSISIAKDHQKIQSLASRGEESAGKNNLLVDALRRPVAQNLVASSEVSDITVVAALLGDSEDTSVVGDKGYNRRE